jgi:cell division protein FtsB
VPGMGLKGMLIMGAVMATMSGAFMLYFKDSQARIATLIQNNAQLEVAVATNEETIRNIQVLNEAANREIRRVNDELAASRAQNRELLGRLAANDLGAFGQTNPEGLERVINRASNNVLRCFELLSGAELNERERNATDGRSFNRECPWMFDTHRSR